MLPHMASGAGQRIVEAELAPWRKHYDPDVPAHISYPRVPIYRFLEDAAAQHPERTCARFFGRRFTYGQLNDLSSRFATALRNMGIGKGDRVALLMPNAPQFIIAYYGILKAGAVIVMLNPLSTQDQLKHNFADSGATVVVTIPLFLANVVPLVGITPLKHIISSRLADFLPFPLSVAQRVQEMRLCRPFKDVALIDFQRLIGNDAPADFRTAPADPDELALLIYTSGTTGAAKGIMLSHFNCVASAHQFRAWVQLTDDDRILSILPLFHIFGMTVTMNVPILAGIETILEPRLEVREIIKAIQKYRPTFFAGIPTIFVAFSHLPGMERYDLSSLRYILVGGAPLPQALKEIFEAKTGARMIEGYGQTEVTPITATPSQGMHKPGSAGIPFPDVEIKIVSLDDGRRLPSGERGEIVVRSPVVMHGYHNKPVETGKTLIDGWLHTGDVGSIDDDGYLYIVDRKQELIHVGSHTVFPRDIDELIFQHPKVKEGITVGIPDPEMGERIKVYLVLKEGEMAAPEAFIAYFRERLAAHLVPSEVEFRSELPKSLIGKILRRVLREEEVR